MFLIFILLFALILVLKINAYNRKIFVNTNEKTPRPQAPKAQEIEESFKQLKNAFGYSAEQFKKGCSCLAQALNEIKEKEKMEVQKPKDDIFNQALFDFFVNEHNLHLLSGEMNDIKHAVYDGILNDLSMFSDDKLDKIFHGVIAEINKRKAEKQGVDVGFWDSEGNYKDDVQKLCPEELNETFSKK